MVLLIGAGTYRAQQSLGLLGSDGCGDGNMRRTGGHHGCAEAVDVTQHRPIAQTGTDQMHDAQSKGTARLFGVFRSASRCLKTVWQEYDALWAGTSSRSETPFPLVITVNMKFLMPVKPFRVGPENH